MSDNKPLAETQHFVLYVAGASGLSSRAILNIQQFIKQELGGNAQLEIVDVRHHCQRAADAQLVALPLLVRTLPLPERKFVGDLADLDRLRLALGIL